MWIKLNKYSENFIIRDFVFKCAQFGPNLSALFVKINTYDSETHSNFEKYNVKIGNMFEFNYKAVYWIKREHLTENTGLYYICG